MASEKAKLSELFTKAKRPGGRLPLEQSSITKQYMRRSGKCLAWKSCTTHLRDNRISEVTYNI